MTVDLARSQQAIHNFLNSPGVGNSSEKKLVIREVEEDGKKVKFIDYAPLNSAERTLRFLGAGSANFKNVVQFAIENHVVEKLVDSDKQAILEKSYTYNRGHNWLRSFMRVNVNQLAQKLFGNEKDRDQVIAAIKQKTLQKERAQAVSMLGPGRGIMQLMEENNPVQPKFYYSKSNQAILKKKIR